MDHLERYAEAEHWTTQSLSARHVEMFGAWRLRDASAVMDKLHDPKIGEQCLQASHVSPFIAPLNEAVSILHCEILLCHYTPSAGLPEISSLRQDPHYPDLHTFSWWMLFRITRTGLDICCRLAAIVSCSIVLYDLKPLLAGASEDITIIK